MTPVSPLPGLPAPLSVDRVRMIRRSMRCFVFGIMGVVPLLGMGMAWLTLRLWRDVAEETGDPARLALANRSSLAAFVLAAVLLYNGLAEPVLALGFLLPVLQGWLLFRQYRRAEPLEWNPARHLAYWGAGLAQAGLVLSSIIIMLGIASAIHPDGR